MSLHFSEYDNPTFIGPHPPVTVGYRVNLTCTITAGYEPSNIMITFKQKRQTMDYRTHPATCKAFCSYSVTHIISSVKYLDAGVYKCHVLWSIDGVLTVRSKTYNMDVGKLN